MVILNYVKLSQEGVIIENKKLNLIVSLRGIYVVMVNDNCQVFCLIGLLDVFLEVIFIKMLKVKIDNDKELKLLKNIILDLFKIDFFDSFGLGVFV